MAKMVFKTGYGERQRVKTEPKGESLTQQHFAHEADVRNIIKQYDKTGLIANVQKGVARYGDYSEVNEYREALDLVNDANAMFAELPAELREMFQNNAGTFLEFATNPENNEKMIKKNSQLRLEIRLPSLPLPKKLGSRGSQGTVTHLM